MLEEGAIERNLVGDAVKNDGVARLLIEIDCTRLHKLSLNAGWISRIDPLDERAGKTVFHAEQHADLLHAVVPLQSVASLDQAARVPGNSVRHTASKLCPTPSALTKTVTAAPAAMAATVQNGEF